MPPDLLVTRATGSRLHGHPFFLSGLLLSKVLTALVTLLNCNDQLENHATFNMIVSDDVRMLASFFLLERATKYTGYRSK